LVVAVRDDFQGMNCRKRKHVSRYPSLRLAFAAQPVQSILRCQCEFAEIAITHSQQGSSHRELRVEADGSLKRCYGGGIVITFNERFRPEAVGSNASSDDSCLFQRRGVQRGTHVFDIAVGGFLDTGNGTFRIPIDLCQK
jgi:hypothetical protein